MFVVVQTFSAKYHLSPFLLPEIKEAPCVTYVNSSGLPWDSDDFDGCSWEVYGYLEFWSKCKSAFQHQGSRFMARKWLFSGFVLNILTKIKKSWFSKACSVLTMLKLDYAKLLWPSMKELDLGCETWRFKLHAPAALNSFWNGVPDAQSRRSIGIFCRLCWVSDCNQTRDSLFPNKFPNYQIWRSLFS